MFFRTLVCVVSLIGTFIPLKCQLAELFDPYEHVRVRSLLASRWEISEEESCKKSCIYCSSPMAEGQLEEVFVATAASLAEDERKIYVSAVLEQVSGIGIKASQRARGDRDGDVSDSAITYCCELARHVYSAAIIFGRDYDNRQIYSVLQEIGASTSLQRTTISKEEGINKLEELFANLKSKTESCEVDEVIMRLFAERVNTDRGWIPPTLKEALDFTRIVSRQTISPEIVTSFIPP